MMSEFNAGMQYLICTFAVWRLTHLFVAEDGPFDLIYRLRKKLGNSVVGKAMDCFYCSSFWIAIPFSMIIAGNWTSRLICWIALSGSASLLEQLTTLGKNQQ